VIKSHKHELLSLLNTMGNMANLLPKMADHSEQIQDILAACECIRENLESENAPKSLELLQAIETSLKESKLDIIEYAKKLKSAFDLEVKANKEVLFLPYKASMWDSLESIYLAAKDDPNWDALVMPIPYYDKIDGKFTEKHWEIDYPKNIPLIDYRKYNLEERHPDIIFIHNPYDGYNIVTSVEPDFYSERLRKLTDCLVYVPYFVGNGINVEKHFCTVPGCLFAHKVIVQTEEERKIYVSAYKEFAKKNKVLERYEQIGNKFLALGSPKLDKAIIAKREDYEISPEWEKLINGKKVVFYNTSIGSLLENTIEDNKPSNKYLQKVKSVFEFFKKQSDAVLLWRPHPLLESTIKSMRPWLEQEYAEIVREYKAGGYGIYDDTDDLNRAIAISDVYYGDGSSVTKLFEVGGKPVSWQVLDATVAPMINGFYDDGNYIWFMDSNNILYRYNKQEKKSEYVEIITGKNYAAYKSMVANNGKLYFAPETADDILFFDINENKFGQINFKANIDENFKYIVSFKNFVYFIPIKYPAIMKLNTNTNEIEYFSEWVNEVTELKGEGSWFFHDYCIIDVEIAIIIQGSNSIIFFNMETGSFEIKSIGEKNEVYASICFDGQNYYIASRYEKYIIKWNRQSNEIFKIKFPSFFSRKKNISGNFLIQYLNRNIWLFPVAANNAYKINVNTYEITELTELTEHFENKDLNFYCFYSSCSKNSIYAFTMNKGIAEYNTDTRKLNFIKPNLEIEPWLFAWLYNYDNWKSKYCKTLEAELSGKKIWWHFENVIGGGNIIKEKGK